MELLFLGVVYPLVGRLSQCAVLGTDTGLDARLMNLLVVSTLYPGDGDDWNEKLNTVIILPIGRLSAWWMEVCDGPYENGLSDAADSVLDLMRPGS